MVLDHVLHALTKELSGWVVGSDVLPHRVSNGLCVHRMLLPASCRDAIHPSAPVVEEVERVGASAKIDDATEPLTQHLVANSLSELDDDVAVVWLVSDSLVEGGNDSVARGVRDEHIRMSWCGS